MRGYAGLVALGLLAAGCSGSSDAPRPLPSLTVSPTPSPTPVTTSSVPPAARALTPQGAGLFARYWYETATAAYASADPTLLRSLASPTCRACVNFTGTVDRLRAAGQHAVGVGFLVLTAESGQIQGTQTRVLVSYRVRSGTYVDGQGAVTMRTASAARVIVSMALRRQDEAWQVAEIYRSRA